MFGLPTSTTVIMGLVMGFWVIYTLTFYVTTRGWAVEDADYDAAPATPSAPPPSGPEPGPSDAEDGGERR